MIKFLVLVILLFSASTNFAQEYQIGIINNLEYDGANSNEIKELVNHINTFTNLKYVVLIGNSTKNPNRKNLLKLKKTLEILNTNYYILPGENDLEWTSTGTKYFEEEFNGRQFIQSSDSNIIAGMSTNVLNSRERGFISDDQISWLNSETKSLNDSSHFIFFTSQNFEKRIKQNRDFRIFAKRFKSFQIITPQSDEKVKNKSKPNNEQSNIISIPNSIDKNGSALFILKINPAGIELLEAEINKGINVLETFEPVKFDFKNPKVQKDQINKNILWEYNSFGTTNNSPLIWNDKIFIFNNYGMITCIDSSSNLQWDYDAFGTINVKPIIADGILAVATSQGDLITLYAESGEQIQTIGFDESITTDLLIIDYDGPRNTMVPKLSNSNSAVVFGTETGKLYCYDLETLEQLWVNERLKGISIGPLLKYDKKIYFSTNSGIIYSISAKQGWILWQFKNAKNISSSSFGCPPIAANGNVYITTNDGFLFSINAKLGSLNWKEKKYKAYKSLSFSKNFRKIYLKGTIDKLHIIDAKNGKWFKEVNIKFGADFSQAAPLEIDNQIYVPTENGILYKVSSRYNSTVFAKFKNESILSVNLFRKNNILVSTREGKIYLLKFGK